MVTKYEVRTQKQSRFYNSYKEAKEKTIKLAQIGLNPELYKVTYKLYETNRTQIYYPQLNCFYEDEVD